MSNDMGEMFCSKSVRNDVHGILSAAYLDASDLVDHRDAAISEKGKHIKDSINRCLEYIRVQYTNSTYSIDSSIPNSISVHNVITRSSIMERSDGTSQAILTVQCENSVIVQRHAAEILFILKVLLQNAFDAVAQNNGATVNVGFVLDCKTAKFTVEDNGPCLSKDVLNWLFPSLRNRPGNNFEHSRCLRFNRAIATSLAIGGHIRLLHRGPSGTQFEFKAPAAYFADTEKRASQEKTKRVATRRHSDNAETVKRLTDSGYAHDEVKPTDWRHATQKRLR